MSNKVKRRWKQRQQKEAQMAAEGEPVGTGVAQDKQGTVVTTIKPAKKWKSQAERGKPVTCSLCGDVTVFIEHMPKQKIRLLMREHQHKEWMGYMVGGVDGPDVMVEDLVIPPHEDSTYASAEAEPFHIPDRCVGVIHSHHTMGAFHSTTDAEHVDANFPVSITVARKENNLEFDTVVNMVTECGRMANVEGKIKFVEPPPTFDEEAWVEEANTNIKKGQNKPTTPIGSRVTQHYPQYPSGTYGGYLGHYWEDEVEKKDNGWGKNGKEATDTVKKGGVYVPVRFRMNSGDIFDTTKGRALTPEEVAAELRQQEIEETMTRFAGWTP